MAQCLVASMTTSSIEPSWLKRDRRYSEPRTSPTHPLSGCTGRVSPRTATGLFFLFYWEARSFSLSLSKMISDLKARPSVFLVVQERSLLAFSASSQLFHRFNSQSYYMPVFNESKQRIWQRLFQKHGETLRRNLLSAGATALTSFLLC
jgi:hypothetical protein